LLALLVSALAVMLTAGPAKASPYGPGHVYYDYGQAERILNNPDIVLYPGVRRDIVRGVASPAVMDAIEYSAARYPITVSAIKTGHPYAKDPTLKAMGMPWYPNAHHYGTAVDIAYVNGITVYPGNPYARRLARSFYYDESFAVQDLGSPWYFGRGSFSDAAHQNHIHIGWPY
jgi:hypothetical protein